MVEVGDLLTITVLVLVHLIIGKCVLSILSI
jgi:hypothetical protein